MISQDVRVHGVKIKTDVEKQVRRGTLQSEPS